MTRIAYDPDWINWVRTPGGGWVSPIYDRVTETMSIYKPQTNDYVVIPLTEWLEWRDK